MKIVVVGNYTQSLVLFRGPLLKRFVDLGCTVIACAPENDPPTAEVLRSMGVEFRQLPFDRTGLSILGDFLLTLRLWRVLWREKPDILLCYTIKPVIFGSIAAHFAGVKRIYSIITGLGYVFMGGGGARRFLRLLVSRLYNKAMSFNDTVFFLNRDDLSTFRSHGIIGPSVHLSGEAVGAAKCTGSKKKATGIAVIDGSGIDLSLFRELPIPKGKPIFLLIARLLADKGIREYVEAARIVRGKYPAAEFGIVGPYDSNPTAIAPEEVQRWVAEGTITYHGETRDVRPFIDKASVYVLPSYREGVPRTVLEAMAMGRPIITTDAPGCRETVIPGENGFLVPVKDAKSLAQAMEQFIIHPELMGQMGQRSRKIAAERFDVHIINDQILFAMGLK